MSDVLPGGLSKLITAFQNLPGVGERTAERYAYFLLKNDPLKAAQLAESAQNLQSSVKQCKITFAYIDNNQDISPLYSNPKRDKQVVAVVAEPFDIVALEKTRAFRGTYHVLGGLISPIDGITPEQLHLKQLIQRVKHDNVKEIILATNASVEGETTALYIQQALSDNKVKITRLARGLPIGVDLEYADQITLSRALEGRQTFL
jgi:recombination protein RecR